jgi:hypothetical protein
MKYLFLLLLLCSFTYTNVPKHVGLKGVKVLDAATQQFAGKNIGYYVKFLNNSKKPVDAIRWKATLMNNFDEVKGVRYGEWQSGNIISPIEPNDETEDIERIWVSGATKVKIVITEVSFI